jgi:pantoate--beta-alanine ligase
MPPHSAQRIEEVRAFLAAHRRAGRSIGFVPTMGALHEGHLSLVRAAKAENDIVVVSIYVNPTQFGASEDLAKYPRTLDRDRELCEREGVDLIFVPSDAVMYPERYATYVAVERLTEGLCGRSRPGHFRGVTTIVAKLFNVVQPDAAYFGWKDAQQAIVIRRMVEDLNLPVRVAAMPIVREPDGLAMSSRNVYLSAEHRRQAPVIHAALEAARAVWERGGADDALELAARIRDDIEKGSEGRIDYVEVVSLDRLEPLRRVERGNTLIAAAVFFGDTRLIDNVRL